MHSVVWTIIKLAFVCFIVGVLLAFFEVDPVSLMRNFPDAISSIFEVLLGWTRSAVPYIMLGAIVVIPIWLVLFLLKLAKRKKTGV